MKLFGTGVGDKNRLGPHSEAGSNPDDRRHVPFHSCKSLTAAPEKHSESYVPTGKKKNV